MVVRPAAHVLKGESPRSADSGKDAVKVKDFIVRRGRFSAVRKGKGDDVVFPDGIRFRCLSCIL